MYLEPSPWHRLSVNILRLTQSRWLVIENAEKADYRPYPSLLHCLINGDCAWCMSIHQPSPTPLAHDHHNSPCGSKP